MTKVITFSLWGNQTKYTIGAIKNADIAQTLYPDFECWVYIHRETVPDDIIQQLQSRSNVKIVFKEGDLNTCKPMMWRFEAINNPDVEIMMSRDTDTRIWDREIVAVNEWISSGKLFHIMRDHPYHNTEILGGMFGTRKIAGFNWITEMSKFTQIGNRNYDQIFLRTVVYPRIVNNSIIHASFHKLEAHSKPFPTKYNNVFNFVGEYVYADDSRVPEHFNMVK